MKNNEEIYPQKMLRGISSKNFIVEGILTEDVFTRFEKMDIVKYRLRGMTIKKRLMS